MSFNVLRSSGFKHLSRIQFNVLPDTPPAPSGFESQMKSWGSWQNDWQNVEPNSQDTIEARRPDKI